MPIRVKSKKMPKSRDMSPVSMHFDTFELPDIDTDDTFREVVKKLSVYFTDVIVLPSTFEQLRTTQAGEPLRVLVDHLNATCTNRAIVNALLALKWHYAVDEAESNKGLCEARANACEIVAWRFLTRLSEREAVDFCLYEIPDPKEPATPPPNADLESNENSPLLSGGSWSNRSGSRRASVRPGSSAKRYQLLSSLSRLTMSMHADQDEEEEDDPTSPFTNLNALEIAAVADAKRFLSQHVVQKIVTGIWNGDIIFWDSLSVHAEKKPRFYNAHTTDIFSRLRVPKYLKFWEAFFFFIFLCLYYSVLVTQNTERITHNEIVLYVWLAAFLYDELSEWADAGTIFYATDIWNLFDMIMIGIGITFAVLRVIGIANHDMKMTDTAFNVFALEALFMVPRVFSLLSLSPYWGTLIPCLKEMSKDFIKFMVLVVIIYLGFLTTFSLIGQDAYTFSHMTMILTKIFFGSSYVGIEIMDDIDKVFGPPLMIMFIILSSFLLMGSLTGMLSNSFSRVITHAREEYLYVYSVYVLEASTSNRLTHFYPPFNLIALVIFRPLRLFLPSDDKFRHGRIILLKATHLPIVGMIQLYESIRSRVHSDEYAGFKGPRGLTGATKQRSLGVFQANRPSSGYRASGRSPRPAERNNHPSSHHSSRPQTRAAEADDMDAPSVVEVRISELTDKIDKLTALVEALQSQTQPGTSPSTSS
ncbi:ion transporter [Colletotrichum scovillei]|uniref:Ion transporter n=1 Tax=Colletotrichum scovillei TaxID=1209932 RepID=A0A9P7QXB4_9PEZI|nr:ion transporter [Colletotrichum scovillei]KAF4778897.1 ion transporter [Colletotrichum scovillei]KAG7039940.1 ion transporter [Colletotrichum scovillei]KAG7042111.1 ion transporter [Colletotrichum scovillei]KAG7062147.1 ion transporter [Colletotrichum scovillei]